jgi:WD40 repeat protein
MVSLALVQLFPENADIVDLVLRHYYQGASGWDTARFDSEIWSVQYGPAGDVIAAGDSDGRIHLICTQTGAKILCLKGHDQGHR